jgi:hypothetical protein
MQCCYCPPEKTHFLAAGSGAGSGSLRTPFSCSFWDHLWRRVCSTLLQQGMAGEQLDHTTAAT